MKKVYRNKTKISKHFVFLFESFILFSLLAYCFILTIFLYHPICKQVESREAFHRLHNEFLGVGFKITRIIKEVII